MKNVENVSPQKKTSVSTRQHQTLLSLVVYRLKHTLNISAIAEVIHQTSHNHPISSTVVLLNTAVTGHLSSEMNTNASGAQLQTV